MEFGISLITIPARPHSKILDRVLLLLAQVGRKVLTAFLFNMSVVFVGSYLSFVTYAQVMHYQVI